MAEAKVDRGVRFTLRVETDDDAPQVLAAFGENVAKAQEVLDTTAEEAARGRVARIVNLFDEGEKQQTTIFRRELEARSRLAKQFEEQTIAAFSSQLSREEDLLRQSVARRSQIRGSEDDASVARPGPKGSPVEEAAGGIIGSLVSRSMATGPKFDKLQKPLEEEVALSRKGVAATKTGLSKTVRAIKQTASTAKSPVRPQTPAAGGAVARPAAPQADQGTGVQAVVKAEADKTQAVARGASQRKQAEQRAATGATRATKAAADSAVRSQKDRTDSVVRELAAEGEAAEQLSERVKAEYEKQASFVLKQLAREEKASVQTAGKTAAARATVVAAGGGRAAAAEAGPRADGGDDDA